jgi:hypothetical protein
MPLTSTECYARSLPSAVFARGCLALTAERPASTATATATATATGTGTGTGTGTEAGTASPYKLVRCLAP